MRTRRFWVPVVMTVALVATAACSGDDDDDSASSTTTGGDGETGTLTVGFAADYGELGAFSDEPATAALEYLVDQMKADGKDVELIVKNINGTPEQTQQAVQELLDSDVDVILGPPFSDLGFPLLTETNGEVPVIFVASTEYTLGDADRCAFLAAFSDPAQSAAMAEYAYDEGDRNSVTFSSPDAPYFQINPDVFTARFEELGGNHLADYTFSLADEDFSTQVNEIANLDPAPDVLYTAMVMPQVQTLLGQLRGAGVDIQVLGADAFDATGVVTAGADANGVAFAAHTFAEPGSEVEAFLDGFEAETGEPLETISFGALASDALNLAVDASERAGSTDSGAICDALKETEGFQGLTGEITYKDTTGTPDKPVFIVQIENEAPTLVKQLEPESVPEP
jgi:branched-chain amino acid transport system substrate-binding protein